MKLQVESDQGVFFIVPYGEMLAGQGDTELRDTLDSLRREGNTKVVVDFSHVPYIDSSILGQLVHGYTQLHAEGGNLRLVNPSSRISEVLELTRLITVLQVYENREQAIDSFQ